MKLLPQFFYGMVVLSSLSMVGDRGGFGGVGMGLGGRALEGALGRRWLLEGGIGRAWEGIGGWLGLRLGV